MAFHESCAPSELNTENNEYVKLDEMQNPELKTELESKLKSLIGDGAIDFLKQRDIEVYCHRETVESCGEGTKSAYHDGSGNFLQPNRPLLNCTFGFKHLERDVYVSYDQLGHGPWAVRGVRIDFSLDADNTLRRFEGPRFDESRPTLGSTTLTFIGFLKEFVQVVDNNIIIHPSNKGREMLYKTYFKSAKPSNPWAEAAGIRQQHRVYILEATEK